MKEYDNKTKQTKESAKETRYMYKLKLKSIREYTPENA